MFSLCSKKGYLPILTKDSPEFRFLTKTCFATEIDPNTQQPFKLPGAHFLTKDGTDGAKIKDQSAYAAHLEQSLSLVNKLRHLHNDLETYIRHLNFELKFTCTQKSRNLINEKKNVAIILQTGVLELRKILGDYSAIASNADEQCKNTLRFMHNSQTSAQQYTVYEQSLGLLKPYIKMVNADIHLKEFRRQIQLAAEGVRLKLNITASTALAFLSTESSTVMMTNPLATAGLTLRAPR